jgi:hypothetical protein
MVFSLILEGETIATLEVDGATVGVFCDEIF